MDEACSRHREGEECMEDFHGKARRKETTRKVWTHVGG
jgi:hypothetical protein